MKFIVKARTRSGWKRVNTFNDGYHADLYILKMVKETGCSYTDYTVVRG